MMDVAHAVRRALRRADEGKTLSLDEAEALLSARADDLAHLMAIACRVRDAGVGRTVSYSRKVFIPLTRLCRDRCGYCTFATTPDKLEAAYMTPEQVLEVARACRVAARVARARPAVRARPRGHHPELRREALDRDGRAARRSARRLPRHDRGCAHPARAARDSAGAPEPFRRAFPSAARRGD